MISRVLRWFDSWMVAPDPENEGFVHISGVQQWESRANAAIVGLVAVQAGGLLLMAFGVWVLAVVASVVFVTLFAQRFHIFVTPYGVFSEERLFGVCIGRKAFGLDARIELYEDFWDGPEHPIGVALYNPHTYDEIVFGPSNDLAAQQALRSVVEQAIRRARVRAASDSGDAGGQLTRIVE